MVTAKNMNNIIDKEDILNFGEEIKSSMLDMFCSKHKQHFSYSFSYKLFIIIEIVYTVAIFEQLANVK
jgi:hypothetical protein